jgi:hypothetical protein
MWDESKPAASQMVPWKRSNDLKHHIEDYLAEELWPAKCPDPRCNYKGSNEMQHRRHLHDIHGYNKEIWSTPSVTRKRCKRKISSSHDQSHEHHDAHPKRPRNARSLASPKGLLFKNLTPSAYNKASGISRVAKKFRTAKSKSTP